MKGILSLRARQKSLQPIRSRTEIGTDFEKKERDNKRLARALWRTAQLKGSVGQEPEFPGG
jgi:hypothetical protein